MRDMKHYIFSMPEWWDPENCYIDINLKTGEYELLNMEPDKIVERYDGKLKQWTWPDITFEEDDGK